MKHSQLAHDLLRVVDNIVCRTSNQEINKLCRQALHQTRTFVVSKIGMLQLVFSLRHLHLHEIYKKYNINVHGYQNAAVFIVIKCFIPNF
jgi:VanZ family protein